MAVEEGVVEVGVERRGEGGAGGGDDRGVNVFRLSRVGGCWWQEMLYRRCYLMGEVGLHYSATIGREGVVDVEREGIKQHSMFIID